MSETHSKWGTRLEALRDELDAVLEYMARYEAVPERGQSTAKGFLQEADWDVVLRAKSVAHRLMIWHMYPTVSPESYFALTDVSSDLGPVA